MFAEGSRYQEEISVVGPLGKLECKVPGPGRFLAGRTAGRGARGAADCEPAPPAPGLELLEDPGRLRNCSRRATMTASTFHEHQKFLAVLQGQQAVEVSLTDGLQAVVIGLAAEHSAQTGERVDLTQGPWSLAG